MSKESLRHRSAAKHHGTDTHPVHETPRRGSRYHNKPHTTLHTGVWARIITIIGAFTILTLLVSKMAKTTNNSSSSGTHVVDDASRNVRVSAPKSTGGDGNLSFVTIVMPSVVNPDARPLRLANIAKTWGPSSRAVFVVHAENEYPEGSQIDEASKSKSYPQNLLVPGHITVDQGVPRLEHVIRTVHKDANPDFAFFVNDHTFVLPENLCRYLKENDSSKDLYAGHALKGKGESAFNSGAAGYVLSRSTMEKLIKEWEDPKSKCSPANASKWIQGNPGLLTAKCFEEVLNIPVVDTRDPRDLSHKFHAYGIIRTVTGKVDDWYMNKHETLDNTLGLDTKYHHQLQSGAKCCSKDTISFHYVENGESIAFWNVLETIRQSPQSSDGEVKELMNKVWPRDKAGLGGYAHGLPGPHMASWDDIIEVIRKISSGVGTPSC